MVTRTRFIRRPPRSTAISTVTPPGTRERVAADCWVDGAMATAGGTVPLAASSAAAHHERRTVCRHAAADAVGRRFGSPRRRIMDAAAAHCSAQRRSCSKSTCARGHHRFQWGLIEFVLGCSRSTRSAPFKPARMPRTCCVPVLTAR